MFRLLRPEVVAKSLATRKTAYLSKGYLTANNGRHPKLYSMWAGMKSRCNNPIKDCYKGITYCKAWEEFPEFRKWVLPLVKSYNGNRHEMSLDRKNSKKGYTPSNCQLIPKIMNSIKGTKSRWRRNTMSRQQFMTNAEGY